MKMQFIDLQSDFLCCSVVFIFMGYVQVLFMFNKLALNCILVFFRDPGIVFLFNVCHCCLKVKNMLKCKSSQSETSNNEIMFYKESHLFIVNRQFEIE